MHISVAGTGYVGLSIATLLAQHNDVTSVDVVPERVDLVNHFLRTCAYAMRGAVGNLLFVFLFF